MLDTVPDSTRLAIIAQALEDALERLAELPESPQVRRLKARALAYRSAVQGWSLSPPSVERREAMVDLVLQLNIEVMKAAEDAGVL